MSNELTLSISLSFTKGDTALDFDLGPTRFDVSGSKAMKHRQEIGTSEEAILLGDAGVGGYFVGVNRDSTNFMEIRPGSGEEDLIRMEPGDFCCFRIADDATPYAIADTAACELEYAVVEA